MASMGPPSMNGGRTSDQDGSFTNLSASMGPPSMNGGRNDTKTPMSWLRVGFNGAAVDERRKELLLGRMPRT